MLSSKIADILTGRVISIINEDQAIWSAINRVYKFAFEYMLEAITPNLTIALEEISLNQSSLVSILETWIQDEQVSEYLLNSIVAQQDSVIESIWLDIEENCDTEGLLAIGVDFHDMMEALSEGLNIGAELEARIPNSPLTNMWIVTQTRLLLDNRYENYYVGYARECYNNFNDGLKQKISHTYRNSERIPQLFSIPVLSTLESKNAGPKYTDKAIFQALALDERHIQDSFSNLREAFNYHRDRLFLLGAAGSGKTFSLLQFGREEAFNRWKGKGNLIPIFVSISTWKLQEYYWDKSPKKFIRWIKKEKDSFAPRNLFHLISNGLAVLLLDGLDELPFQEILRYEEDAVDENGNLKLDSQGKSIKQLKTITIHPREYFLGEIPKTCKVILTSRKDAYDEIKKLWIKDFTASLSKKEKELPEAEQDKILAIKIIHKQGIEGMIELRDLDNTTILSYMGNDKQLLDLVQNDRQLMDMLRNPLMLSLFNSAYSTQPAILRRELKNFKSGSEELRNNIFQKFIEQRFIHENSKLSRQVKLNLREFMQILGDIAIKNILEGISLKRSLADLGYKELIPILIDLNLLLEIQGNFEFTHAYIRDYIAYEIALVRIEEVEHTPAHETMEYDRTLINIIISSGDSRAKIPLMKLFNSTTSWLTKCRAIRAFGELNIIEMESDLIALLSNKDMDTRAMAAMALGKLQSKKAVEKLIPLLNNNAHCEWVDAQVCVVVADALENIGTEDALKALSKWAETDGDDMSYSYY